MTIVPLLLAFGGGLLLVYLVGMVLVVPLKWLVRLLVNSVIGFLILAAINAVGMPLLGFSIPLNLVNVLVSGVLGVPGVVLLVLFRLFL